MTYSYTCVEYSDEFLQSILQNNPVVSRVEILASSVVEVSSNSQFSATSFTLISKLLEESFIKEPISLFLRAVPQSQVQINNGSSISVDNSVHTHDIISYNSLTSKLHLQLTHQSFQRVPALQPNDYVKITKMAPTKRGHGSKQQVTYSRSIVVDLTKLREAELVKVKHIVDKIFHSVQICISTNDLSTEITRKLVSDYGLLSEVIESQCKQLNVPHDVLSLCASALESEGGSPSEIYEYLGLVLLNSVQITTTVEDYISSYEIPFPQDECGPTQMYKSFLVGSDFHSMSLAKLQNWDALSLHTESTHILILKRNDTAFVWKCT
ncbi:hypothetical protein CLIB1423_33S00738 [[Candida] railenensis]|uniref:Uncharacterized protein n=1 Tax=[Candida] railenensis TaxID=45579 RepID=A0A9P0QUA3_9ASCO|nr:hypothetical protein CLIB1423_33S00738 [[Candida] railenensis]